MLRGRPPGNFGGFATPERKIIFSINDLDETLPAPWEWDVKRLAASFVVACRDNGLSDGAAKDVAMTCVRTYRESMAEFSQMKTLELWYYALGGGETGCGDQGPQRPPAGPEAHPEGTGEERRRGDLPQAGGTQGRDAGDQGPAPDDLPRGGPSPGKVQQILKDAFAGYRDTLATAHQSLLERYEIRDAAIKVVGIGSVGTAAGFSS